jgi:heptosyltransferase II
MKKQVKLSSQKRIDSFFGGLLNQLIISMKFFGKREIKKNPKKILFFKTEAVGDSLLCLPMIKEIKKKTNAKIYVLCSNTNSFVFEKQSFVDEIRLIDDKKFDIVKISRLVRKLRKENIEVVIDTGQSSNISAILSYFIGKSSIGFKKIKGTSRNKVYDYAIDLDTKKHMVHVYFDLAQPLRIKEPKEVELEKIKISKKEEEKISRILKNKKNLVGFHACNLFDYRTWPKEKFAQIIEFLIKEKNKTVVLTGSPEEIIENKKLIELIDIKIRNKIINCAGQINLKETIALMRKLEMFISNDGGPMHIAASEDIPVIGLFGYETPVRYGPFNKKSIAIYKNKECSPCHRPYSNQWTNCSHHNCIKEISVEEVKKAIKKIDRD